MKKLVFSALPLLLAFAATAAAQSPLDGFDPDANDFVYSIAVQADGKILVGGAFTTIGGQARNRIARLNADGSLDTGFNPGANDVVWAIAVQADGKILASGFFTSIGGQSRNRIARLHPDGTVDEDFDPNANGTVYSIAVQADGKILAGGAFTTIGGQARNYIARLNADGTADADFNPGANSIVLTLAVQADGKVLVGGYFTTIGGQTRNRIARLNADGTLDAAFNPGANDVVLTLAVQADGKVLVGGNFTTVGGQPRNYFVRLNTDGTMDAGFDPDANGYLSSIAVQADGKILVGGNFTTIGGQARNRIARLYPDGKLDTGFNPGANGYVRTIAVQADGKILVGGAFTTIGGQDRNHIARLNADGTADAAFNPGANDVVLTLAVQADGKILAGGEFTTIGGQARNYIARLNADGSLDAGFDPNANDGIYSIAVQSDGKVLAGGAFTAIGGQARNYIARLYPDGTLDTGFNPGANSFLSTIAVQADGKVLAGGAFTTIGGQARNYIARLNADGSLDAGFDPNANNTAYTIAVQADGKVLAGGYFTAIGGQARNRIARLNADGTADAGFDPNANDGIYSIAVQADGKVLAGGAFTTIGGQARNRIARLSSAEAALQELGAANKATVRWMRSGAGPELYDVWFESSADLSNWSSLGAGARIAGGWELTGLSLPDTTNIYIRASGHARGGYFNGSGSIVESVRNVFFPDTDPPSIVWTSPAWDATGVGLSEPIVVAFSEPMDTGSVDGYPSGNSFTLGWNAGGDTLTLTPQYSYQYNTLYWIIVTAGTDLAGNSLPGLPDTCVQFTTLANQGPAITMTLQPGDTYDGTGPFAVRAVIADPAKAGVIATTLYYNTGAGWSTYSGMLVQADTFDFTIYGPFSAGTLVSYYIMAADDAGDSSYSPANAPIGVHQFRILDPLPPSNLAAQAGDMMVELSWAPPAEVLDYSSVPNNYFGWDPGDVITTRFTPQHYPCRIEQAVSLWYDDSGMDSVEIHVWPDDGTGIPDMAADLMPPFSFMPLNYPNWTVLDVSAHNIVLSSGDFHIGYVCRTANHPHFVSDDEGPGLRSLVYDAGSSTWGNLIVYATDYLDLCHQAAVTYSSHYAKGLALKSYRPRKNDKPLPAPAGFKAMPIVSKQAPVYPELKGALAMAKNINQYNVFRGDVSGGPYVLIAALAELSYTDNDASNGNSYFYVVKAQYVVPDTFSANSNEATATPAAVPILLVNDAANSTDDAEAIYTAAMDGAGYSGQYTVYQVGYGDDGPSSAWFANRSAVVWWTGDDYETTLYPADEANLATYLNGGGKLFLSADDYIYNVYNSFEQGYRFTAGQFPYDFLGVDSVWQDFVSEEDFTMAGVAGNFAEGQSFLVPDGNPQINYPDDLIKRPAAGIYDIFDVTAKVGEKPGIAYDHGVFRTVFFAFPFENIVDGASPSTKAELMYRILNWLNTGVEGPSTPLGTPTRFELTANYPNPVRSNTTIKFGLPKESQVRVEVYNIAGQRVKSLANGKLGAGYHQISWKGANDNGQKVAAGVYLVRMVTPEFNATRRMTVVR